MTTVDFTNFHGNITRKNVDWVTVPDAPESEQIEFIQSVVSRAIREGKRIRPMGSTWSMSPLVAPDEIALDTGMMSGIGLRRFDASDEGGPVWNVAFAQGGVTIDSINRRLGRAGFALKTSGAGNGHRIAGAIATGTHGAATGIGAIHDALRGDFNTHVDDGTDRFNPSLWLVNVPQECAVHLGAMGVVTSVTLDIEPLYTLRGKIKRLPRDCEFLARAMRKMDSGYIWPEEKEDAYHLEVVFDPYSQDAYALGYWKEAPKPGHVFEPACPSVPDIASDHMGLIADLSDALDGRFSTGVLADVVSQQIESRYRECELPPAFPGQVFGYTSLPPGHGISTEVAVPTSYVETALRLVFRELEKHEEAGELLLGAVACRFVKGSDAYIAMNRWPKTAFIELPAIRTDEAHAIYRSVWKALEEASVPYVCHWGQVHEMGDYCLSHFKNPRAWVEAREALLSVEERRVFETPASRLVEDFVRRMG